MSIEIRNTVQITRDTNKSEFIQIWGSKLALVLDATTGNWTTMDGNLSHHFLSEEEEFLLEHGILGRMIKPGEKLWVTVTSI